MRGANYIGNCSGFEQLLYRRSDFIACVALIAGKPAPTGHSQASSVAPYRWAPLAGDKALKEGTPSKIRTISVRKCQNPHLKSAHFNPSPGQNARKRPLLSRARHFRALACNLLPCEAGKLGRLSAPSNTLFPGQRPTAL